MAILQTKNLTFRYPEEKENALSGVTLTVEPGEFVVIAGASGSGKTTLLRLLKREIAPYGKKTGDVLLDGIPQEEMEERDSVSGIGFVFQDPESQIVNTVTLSGTGLATPLTAEATVTVTAGPELRIVKSLSPAAVEENGNITYSFQIQNYGNEPAGAEAAIAVSDLFDPILSNLSVSLDGQSMAKSTGYTYNETTGQFDTLAGQITVPAATYAQDTATGNWVVTPGETVLTVTGTV